MKKSLKSLISMLMVFVMVFTFFAMNTVTVNAAEAGTLVSNAIVLNEDQWHTKYWTSQNDDLNCYNKIVVPSRGYITFTAQKPFDDEGELCSYIFTLYNPNGVVVWEANSSAQKNSFNEYYTYKIGLAAGTYYMNLNPSFYVYSSSAPIPSKYKYTFTETSYWEVEPNNDKLSASQMTLGKKYTGVYTEESYNTSYDDYYKVKLTKGKFYKLTIGNYNELKTGTAILNFYDPNYKDILSDLKESGKSKFMIFKAGSSGWYYFHLGNDGNDAGIEYTVTVSEHIKKSQTISGPTKIIRYGYDDFKMKKYKYSAKTELSYSENSKILSIWNDKIDPDQCGTATITVKAKETDTYKSATKKVTIIINPANPNLNSLKANKKGGLVIKYNTNDYNATTQIQIATNSKFTKGVKNYYDSDGYGEKTIKNLKAGTKYYVRIRNYDKYNGKKYYSKWSKTLSKKVTVSVPTAKISDAYSWSWDDRQLEVSWYQSDDVTGYQVQIATNSKFTKNKKTKTINGNDYDDCEYKFKKLKRGKKYYARVRAFIKTGGKVHYGKWSKVKSDVIS